MGEKLPIDPQWDYHALRRGVCSGDPAPSGGSSVTAARVPILPPSLASLELPPTPPWGRLPTMVDTSASRVSRTGSPEPPNLLAKGPLLSLWVLSSHSLSPQRYAGRSHGTVRRAQLAPASVLSP